VSGYQRLISAATVGLGGKALPELMFDAPVDASAAALCDPADPLGSTLRVAGLYAVARRAGQLATAVQPTVEPAPPETRPLITDTHAFLMEQALTVRPILDGVIGDIAAAGRRLPPRLIPELLLMYHKDVVGQQLWEAIGTGGQWYAAQRYRALRHFGMPADSSWPDEVQFTHGEAAQRLSWLRTARCIDPDRARELVVAHWASEDASSRAQLIAEFSDPEHAADEPFLEAALEDPAATVHSAAVDALTYRSRSRYLDRLKETAAQIFSAKKTLLGAKITVNVIAEPGTVANIVARTPIAFWNEFFTARSLPPEKVVRALGDASDAAVLAALTTSALRGDDPVWTAALIRTLAGRSDLGAPLVGLVASLPRPFAPDVAAALFDSLGGTGWGKHPQRRDAAYLAAGFPLDWHRRFADLVDRTGDAALHKFYATVFELLTLRIDIAKELP
jgi:hypothetical protein